MELADMFFLLFCMYFIQHFFVCRHSDFTVSEDAGIEPRTFETVATLAVAARRSRLLMDFKNLDEKTKVEDFCPMFVISRKKSMTLGKKTIG
jgi:hypothetical protein